MLAMPGWDEISVSLRRTVPIWQPRTMAGICFASALVQLGSMEFEMDGMASPASVVVTAGSGVIYWMLARRFRVWTMYLVVAVGLGSGMVGVGEVSNQNALMLMLITLLWTCVLTGLAFRPGITRAFAAYICVGLAVATYVNPVEGEGGLTILFAASLVVTMEILTRISTRLRVAASTDPLTGVLNRGGLERELERVRGFGRGRQVSLLMVDLDDFKGLNDRLGHLEGDRALRDFARVWQENVRAGDLIGRIGGDEFVVVFPETDLEAVEALVSRLREISPVEWSGDVVVSEPGESLDAMYGRADRLLYAEKARKKDRDRPEIHSGGVR